MEPMKSATTPNRNDPIAAANASGTNATACQQQAEKPIEKELDECEKLLDHLGELSADLNNPDEQRKQDQEAFLLLNEHRIRFEHNRENARRRGVQMTSQCENDIRNYDEILRLKALDLTQMRENFKLQQQNMYNSLDQVQQRVLCHFLADWRRRQKFAGNECNLDKNLAQIQACCEMLMCCLWNNRITLKTMEMAIKALPLNSDINTIVALANSYTRNIRTLIAETVVLEKQPPQVIKTRIGFMASVRSLCGNSLDVHTISPEVNVKIINEQQADAFQRNYNLNEAYRHYPQRLYTINNMDTTTAFGCPMQMNFSNHPHQPIAHKFDFSLLETSGDICYSSGFLEYQSEDERLSCNLNYMQLDKIKRSEKRSSQSVLDEKFTLLFHATHRVGYSSPGSSNYQDDELEYDMWAMSLPVVVIVSRNQETQAWATITWDNALAERNRLPFKVPELVYWAHLGAALSNKFGYFCGRGLDVNNLRFLATKALGVNLESDNDYHDVSITWDQFAKDQLSDGRFTFWEWFYSICRLTRDYLKSMWIDRRIMGFVSRRDVENLLLNNQSISSASGDGTFLIRFSESKLSGISIAWCHPGPNSNQREILMLQPFSDKDLVRRSLAGRIKDVSYLLYLYPDTPKDIAFQPYYTSDCVIKKYYRNNDYIGHRLVQAIVDHPNSDCQATPDSSYAPSTSRDINHDKSSSQNIDSD